MLTHLQFLLYFFFSFTKDIFCLVLPSFNMDLGPSLFSFCIHQKKKLWPDLKKIMARFKKKLTGIIGGSERLLFAKASRSGKTIHCLPQMLRDSDRSGLDLDTTRLNL